MHAARDAIRRLDAVRKPVAKSAFSIKSNYVGSLLFDLAERTTRAEIIDE